MTAHHISSSSKVIVWGNCQSDSLVAALQKRFPSESGRYEGREVASPLTYLSHPGEIPEELRARFSDPVAQLSLEGRSLRTQYELIGNDEPEPQAMIFTLFHETTPLLKHKAEGYLFYVSNAVHGRSPELTPWLRDSFIPFQADPVTYYERFFGMIDAVRQRFPKMPILIVKRLANRMAYGPKPYSYLECWDRLWRDWSHWIVRYPWLTVLDLDRVVGGVMSNRDLSFCQLFPFLRPPVETYRFRKYRRRIPRLIAPLAFSRDIEHGTAPIWESAAQHVSHWLQTGKVEYQSEECPVSVRTLWTQFQHLSRFDMTSLETRDPFHWANAIEALIVHPRLIDWPRLEACATHFPADRLLLRALRAFLDVHPAKASVPFLERHVAAVAKQEHEAFWKARYLTTVQEMIRDQQRSKR